MEHHVTIPIGSDLWWNSILLSFVALVVILFISGKLKKQNQDRLAWLIAGSIILREILWHYYLVSNGTWSVAQSLPLHLCSFSRMMCIYLLIRKSQLLFEFLLLMGMAGAIQALITPELTHGLTNFLLFDFYYAHVVIVLTALFLFFIRGERLTNRSWINAFLFGNLVLICVGLFNYAFGGNYIYLCQKPLAQNPLVMGEWPWYLLSFEIFGLFHIVLFWILFRFIQKKKMNNI